MQYLFDGSYSYEYSSYLLYGIRAYGMVVRHRTAGLIIIIINEWLTPLFIRWRNAFQACPYHICTVHVTAAGRY